MNAARRIIRFLFLSFSFIAARPYQGGGAAVVPVRFIPPQFPVVGVNENCFFHALIIGA